MSKDKRKSNQVSQIKGPLIIVGLVITTLVFVVAGAFAFSAITKGPEIIASQQVNLTTSENSYNWGTIDMSNGKVSHTFDITNKGSEALKLYDAITSCTCTTVQLKYGDQVSPQFGMHTNSNYVLEVPPGEKAQVEVVFDPAFHGPSGVGSITREVIIKTNDANQPELNFTTTANVTR